MGESRLPPPDDTPETEQESHGNAVFVYMADLQFGRYVFKILLSGELTPEQHLRKPELWESLQRQIEHAFTDQLKDEAEEDKAETLQIFHKTRRAALTDAQNN